MKSRLADEADITPPVLVIGEIGTLGEALLGLPRVVAQCVPNADDPFDSGLPGNDVARLGRAKWSASHIARGYTLRFIEAFEPCGLARRIVLLPPRLDMYGCDDIVTGSILQVVGHEIIAPQGSETSQRLDGTLDRH